MGWLGLDDTDSLNGGCTTEVFHRLIEDLPSQTTVGEPCLVRLWPFAHRRTRGNAAMAVELNHPNEDDLLEHLDVWWETYILPLQGEVASSAMSSREQHPTSPGMVWFKEKPSATHYWTAVRGHVGLDSLPVADRSWGEFGRIGASAAAAWDETPTTWEAIVWRQASAQGPRRIDEETLAKLDEWPSIVFSRDPRRGTQLIAPRGRSPVLFGLRSRSSADAERGCQMLLNSPGTEHASGWRVFRTNQASGDHLTNSYILTVRSSEVHPERKHVRLETEQMPVLMFAEGGPVNALGRWVMQGDRIEVRGLIDREGCLHAEQARVIHAVARRRMRPLCSTCSTRLKSMGSNQGLRCPSCKAKTEDAWDDVDVACPFLNWVEPHVGGRRHLSRPLEWSSTA
jgi:tRNA(Ile2)-agmatinylcytidine synthase